KETDWVNLGGAVYVLIAARKGDSASLVAEVADFGERPAADVAADLAFGAILRSYRFRKYATKPREDNGDKKPANGLTKLVIHTEDADKARAAFAKRKAVADGVFLARDLVNEPANM